MKLFEYLVRFLKLEIGQKLVGFTNMFGWLQGQDATKQRTISAILMRTCLGTFEKSTIKGPLKD